jgi:DNA modification methylase
MSPRDDPRPLPYRNAPPPPLPRKKREATPSQARARPIDPAAPVALDETPAAVWVPLSRLKPWPGNPTKDDPASVRRVIQSIERFGFGAPLVARAANGEIIAGHARFKAAQLLKLPSVPVRFMEISETDAHALAIADNRLAALTQRSDEALAAALRDMPSADQVIAGYEQPDYDKLIRDVEGTPELTEDEAPEPPKVPVTKLDDVWLLGRHRLVCGDSTHQDVVERAMAGERAVCVFTDPPYGVSIGAKNRFLNSVQPSGRNLTNVEDDALSPEDLKARLLPAFCLLRDLVCGDECSIYVSSPQGGGLSMMMMMMMQEAGLRARHVLIWKKNAPTFSMGRLDYDYQHEPILFTWRQRHKRPMGGKHRTSVWDIDKPRSSAEHPTMKPVELYATAYLNSSDDGDNVADIYAGSGTAFAAAEQLNRRCFGIELSPAYCDVIIQRWQNLTGQKATRE